MNLHFARCLMAIAITIAPGTKLLAGAGITELGGRVQVKQYPSADLVLFHSRSTGDRVDLYQCSTLKKVASYLCPKDDQFADFAIELKGRKFIAVTAGGKFIAESLQAKEVNCNGRQLIDAARSPLHTKLCCTGERVVASTPQGVRIWDTKNLSLVGTIANSGGGSASEIVADFTSTEILVIFEKAAIWYEAALDKEIAQSAPIEPIGVAGTLSLTGRYYALPGNEKIFLFDRVTHELDFVEWISDSRNANSFAFADNDQYFLCQQGKTKGNAIDVWKLEGGLKSMSFLKPIKGCVGGAIAATNKTPSIAFHGSNLEDKDIKGLQIRAIADSQSSSFGSQILTDNSDHPTLIAAMAISNAENLLAVCTLSGMLQLWDITSPLIRIDVEGGQAPKVTKLKSGALRGTVTVPDTESIQFLAGDRGLIVSCKGGQSYLISVDENFSNTSLVSIDLGRQAGERFYPVGSEVRQLDFSKEGTKLIATHLSSMLVADVTTTSCEIISLINEATLGGWFHSTGKSVFMIRSTGGANLDLRSKGIVAAPQFGKPNLRLTGHLVPGIYLDEKLSIIDVENGTLTALLSPQSIIKGLTDLSDDGSLLVSGGAMKEGNDIGLEIIEVKEGKTLSTIQVESNGLYGVFFLNDKSKVAVCGAKSIRIYDYRRNRLVSEFPKPETEKVNQDDKPTPVTASAFMSWLDDAASGGLLVNRVLRAVAHHAPSGRVAISKYKTVEVWDTTKESLLWSTVLDGENICQMAFSPDGRRLAIGMSSGRLRVVTFDPKL